MHFETGHVITIEHISLHSFAGYFGEPQVIRSSVAGETIMRNHEKIPSL